MISAEAPVLFSKACELFILDLTLRSWAWTTNSSTKRRTLQKNDIACAIQNSLLFDFLQEIVPVTAHNPEEEGTPPHVRQKHVKQDATDEVKRMSSNVHPVSARWHADCVFSPHLFAVPFHLCSSPILCSLISLLSNLTPAIPLLPVTVVV